MTKLTHAFQTLSSPLLLAARGLGGAALRLLPAAIPSSVRAGFDRRSSLAGEALDVGSDPVEKSASLSPGYAVEVDQFSKTHWDDILANFEDANLYQSWSYSTARWGEKNLSRLVLRQDGELVGAAQVLVVKVPVIGSGLAYVKWGPVWQARGRPRNIEVYRQLLRSLRQVYAVERGLLLRVTPWEWDDDVIKAAIEEEGFHLNPASERLQTAIFDLAYSMDELRKSLTRHWRYNLRMTDRNNLEVAEGVSDELVREFLSLYAEMRARKTGGWIPPIGYFAQVQRDMSDSTKPWISICRHEGKAVAGLVVSTQGSKSLALFAATGNKGLDLRGSYLLWWRAIQRLKAQGVNSLDMGGINAKTHPGTTQFKLGLCGKLGRQVEYLGDFYTCKSWVSRWMVKSGDSVRMVLIKARENLREWRRARGAKNGDSHQ